MPQYQGVWSLQQQMQALTSGQWATDPLFDYTTLLLQADNAANSAQNNTFLDSSTNSFAITRNGGNPGMTQGTFSPFSLQPGEWSNYFPGSASISFSASSGFDINTYDCFECWVNLSVLGTNIVIAGKESNFWIAYNNTNINGAANKFVFSINNGSSWQAVSSNTTPVVGTWYHVAGIRDSGTLRLYINGVQENTGTFTGTPVNSSFAFSVGAYAGSVDSMTGYVSNVRLVTGATAAVLPYTANFTPSPRPLTAVTGTQILTCQGSRFFDANTQTTAKTLGTITSTPSVQAFSPFAPQFQYTASGTGGSGYFDGTGDFLTLADNAAFTMGTGDFTIEYWTYVPTLADMRSYGQCDSVPNVNTISFFGGINGSSKGYCGVRSGTTEYACTSTANFPRNQWVHHVLVRDGTTLRQYINGVQDGTSSVGSASVNDSSFQLAIGRLGEFNAYNWNGYIGSFRIVKGGCLYPSGTTFTPPTAPFTTTVSSGTVSLLTNFTNAGILDGTMKNNLETVGGASVSTSVVKYGSGSMYFDGTGDWLLGPSTQNCVFSSGDFTVEFWCYPTTLSASTDYNIIDFRDAQDTTSFRIGINGTTIPFVAAVGGILSGSFTFTTNTWYHFAVTRRSGTLTIWINGTSAGTNTTTTTFTGSKITVGAAVNNAGPYFGYLDDIRVTKGIARYTQNFIPPSVALPRQ